MKIRGAMIAALIAALPAAAPGESRAQAWRPEKAVEIVVPTAASGINDQLSRLMQKVLQDEKLVSVPMVVMNKPGGNQSLSVVYMSQRAADPHFLMYSTATLFTNQIAGLTELSYKDLTPVALLVEDYSVITVGAGSPIKTLKDLVDRLKADPGAAAFGMVSRGGPNHLALSQAMRSAGVDPRKLRVVVFKTNAESMTAAMGGHIQAVVSSVSAALPQAQAGNTRMLAVVAPQRGTGAIANVPTTREQGIDATGISNWRAIFAAKGVTPAQAAYWDDALAKMAASEEWKKEVDGTNMAQRYLRAAAFAKFLDAEHAATRAVMADLGLTKAGDK
jgi:putative tricarboxylic transport membrane protein